MSTEDDDGEEPEEIDHPPLPDTVGERVDYIFRLMVGMQFVRGRTSRAIAQAWGLSKTRVEDYSAEASRRVKAEINDPDGVAADVGILMARGLRDLARQRRWKDVFYGADVLTKIMGAAAPTKLKVETSPASLSEEELRTQLTEAIRVLAAEDPGLVAALKGEEEGGTPVQDQEVQ